MSNITFSLVTVPNLCVLMNRLGQLSFDNNLKVNYWEDGTMAISFSRYGEVKWCEASDFVRDQIGFCTGLDRTKFSMCENTSGGGQDGPLMHNFVVIFKDPC